MQKDTDSFVTLTLDFPHILQGRLMLCFENLVMPAYTKQTGSSQYSEISAIKTTYNEDILSIKNLICKV